MNTVALVPGLGMMPMHSFWLSPPTPHTRQLIGSSLVAALVLGDTLALGEALVLAPDPFPPTAVPCTSVAVGLPVLASDS